MTYLIIFLQKPSGNGLVGDLGRACGVLQGQGQGQGQAMATDTDLVSASVKGSHVETDQSPSPTASTICEGRQPVASCLCASQPSGSGTQWK